VRLNILTRERVKKRERTAVVCICESTLLHKCYSMSVCV